MDNLIRYLEDTVFYQDLPGIAVSIKTRNKICRKALGYCDFPQKIPMRTGSVFHCASVAKLFTSVAIMQLIESDRLHLDDRVSDIIAGFKINDKRADDITIQNLLAHTSGIGMVYDFHWDMPETEDNALAEYVLSDEIRKRTLLASPEDNVFNYSDAGYDILGAVTAVVSEMTFEEYIDEYIFKPANMGSSSFMTYSRPDKDMLVRPHTKDSTKHIVYENHYPYNRIHAPSSTLTSNLYDLEKFAEINIRSSKATGINHLLKPETYKTVWNKRAKTLNKNEYMGLGWFVYERNGYIYYGHNGGDDGFASGFWICPELDFYLIVLTNTRNVQIKKICRDIFDMTAAAGI